MSIIVKIRFKVECLDYDIISQPIVVSQDEYDNLVIEKGSENIHEVLRVGDVFNYNDPHRIKFRIMLVSGIKNGLVHYEDFKFGGYFINIERLLSHYDFVVYPYEEFGKMMKKQFSSININNFKSCKELYKHIQKSI